MEKKTQPFGSMRALLAYRRTLVPVNNIAGIADREGVLFQTKTGTRFTGSGFERLFRRLSKQTGIHVTSHALRRTFTILSLRAGMNPLHLQNLGGWESLELVQHYAQHSPVDRLKDK